jgi:hypothetical protein
VISRTEAKEALLRSGYLLEQRVKSFLDTRCSYVEQNVNYPDETTGKYREYDLHALCSRNAGDHENDVVMGSLAVECVNNPEPMALLTNTQRLARLNGDNVRIVGSPLTIKTQRGDTLHLRDILNVFDQHYIKGPVGTQFCSFMKKKSGKIDEWMALHDDAHFESIAKVCAAIEHQAAQLVNAWLSRRPPFVNVTLLYPVIVLQGELWEARHTKRSVHIRSADHLQLQRTLIAPNKQLTYQIDIVRERALPQLLDIIERELDRVASMFKSNTAIARKAVEATLAAPEPESKEHWLRLLSS